MRHARIHLAFRAGLMRERARARFALFAFASLAAHCERLCGADELFALMTFQNCFHISCAPAYPTQLSRLDEAALWCAFGGLFCFAGLLILLLIAGGVVCAFVVVAVIFNAKRKSAHFDASHATNYKTIASCTARCILPIRWSCQCLLVQTARHHFSLLRLLARRSAAADSPA